MTMWTNKDLLSIKLLMNDNAYDIFYENSCKVNKVKVCKDVVVCLFNF